LNEDLVRVWLNSVAYSHSQSEATEINYKRVWGQYSAYIGMSAKEIVADYEGANDRTVMRKYAGFIRSWIGNLSNSGLTNSSIRVMVGTIKSFHKHNDLPLGHVPHAMGDCVYHNRDITKDEIVQIMAGVKIREKAFFAVMAQSGLRPFTIKQLKLKHLEEFDKIPCKIEVPKEISKGKYGSYVTFIGSDAIKYIKQYLATRKDLTAESLLFCSHFDSKQAINTKDVSRVFKLSAQKLEKSGAIKYEVRERKPSEIRLYNLRKFFRKYANQMGFENVNYLMGHTVRGSDAHYKPQDPEFYRELYAEKAMPFLRLDDPTPTETSGIIDTLKKQHNTEMEMLQKQLQKRDTQIQALNGRFNKYEKYFKLLENNVKPNPSEEEIQITEKLMPSMEAFLYKDPKKVAELFWNDNAFRKYAISKISQEELVESKKIAKEQNITLDEVLRKKFVQILKRKNGYQKK